MSRWLPIVLLVVGSICFSVSAGTDGDVSEAQRYLKLLDDDSPLVRKRALVVLERLGAKARPPLPVLLKLLDAADPGVRRWAALNLGQMGNDAASARDVLIASLNDVDPAARAAKAAAIDIIDEQAQVAALLRQIRDAKHDKAARGVACKEAASRFPHDPAVRKAFADALTDPAIKAAACEAWKELARQSPLDPAGRDALEAALTDPLIKRAAAEALEAADQPRPARPGPRALRTLKGHTSVLRALAFSPYGKRLASANVDFTVRVWDADSGELLLTLKHPAEVDDLAFSPDGLRLVSACRDRTVRVWDAFTDKEPIVLKGDFGPVWSVAFSPDGKRLAVAADYPDKREAVLKLCDAASGKVLLQCEEVPAAFGKVTFSPDGARVAAATGMGLAIWDASSGKTVHVLDLGNIGGVAYSPDGGRVAVSGNEVKVLDARDGHVLFMPTRIRSSFSSVVFSPDGRLMAFAMNPDPGGEPSSIWVCEAATGKNLAVLKGPTDSIGRLAFNRDGTLLASSRGNIITIWDLTALK